MNSNNSIERFLSGATFAVVGASVDREKYGNKVLRAYIQDDRQVHPVNPRATVVEGLPAFGSLSDVPGPVSGVSIITPPRITEAAVQEAIALGIPHVWMQPGAESDAAISAAEDAGINVIHSGPCLLVVLGYREVD